MPNVDRLNRLLTNFWTAVFEKPGPTKQNRVIRDVSTQTETIYMGESGVAVGVTEADLTPRYVEKIGVDRTIWSASMAIDSNTALHYPYNGTFNDSQMWMACRIYPTWAYNAAPTTYPTILSLEGDADSYLRFRYSQAANSWQVIRSEGAGSGTLSLAGGHAAVAPVNLVFAVTATQLKISLDGAAFQTLADTNVPTAHPTTAYLFNLADKSQPIAAFVYWFVLGTGTLTDADAAALGSYTSSNFMHGWSGYPGRRISYGIPWDSVPSHATSLPTLNYGQCLDSDASQGLTHVAIAAYGECNYG
jgi:hypothetical protein